MLREQIPAGKDEQQSASPRPAVGQGARLLFSLWNMLLARRGLLAALPALAAVVLLFCGASWQIFWIHTDAARYQCYALAFWQGSQGTSHLPGIQCAFLYQSGVPQGSFPALYILPFEYPPLTL